jgi:hypothetical protein
MVLGAIQGRNTEGASPSVKHPISILQRSFRMSNNGNSDYKKLCIRLLKRWEKIDYNLSFGTMT